MYRGLCNLCTTSVAAHGFVCGRGRDVQGGLTVSGGPCGVVALRAASLPPPPSKFCGFRDLTNRLLLKRYGRYEQVQPEDLLKLPPEAEGRVRCRLVGAAIAGARPYVSNTCLYNGIKAVLCRVFRSPKYQARVRAWATVRRLDDLLIGELFALQFIAMTIDEWIGEAEPRRVPALLQAREELDKYGWRQAWELFSSFLKGEKLPWFEEFLEQLVELRELVDRLIQGPHDCTHLIAGVLLKPLTKMLKKVWSEFSPIFYAAVSVEKLDLWFNRNYVPGSWGLMCDYTMFDNSHSHYSWDWVESIYRRMGFFEMEPRFEKVMKAWREPRGTMHGKGWTLKYAAYVMNASGRDDTSLANALLNGACMFLSLTAVFSGKQVEDLGPADVLAAKDIIRLSICGDDSLALLPYLPCSPDLFCVTLSAHLAKFGFTAGADKMKVSMRPFDFVYLGMRPYFVDGRWYFAKTIGRALWKFGWQFDPRGSGPAWMAGNCKQVLATQRVVPLLSDLAEAYLKQHRGPATQVREYHKPWQRETATPDYTLKVLMDVADGYGVALEELKDCIRYIRSLDTFPCVMDHPVLTKIMCVDEM